MKNRNKLIKYIEFFYGNSKNLKINNYFYIFVQKYIIYIKHE